MPYSFVFFFHVSRGCISLAPPSCGGYLFAPWFYCRSAVARACFQPRRAIGVLCVECSIFALLHVLRIEQDGHAMEKEGEVESGAQQGLGEGGRLRVTVV
eukprot:scaffold10744_cov84-Isochrysis_galbana.AAC.1